MIQKYINLLVGIGLSLFSLTLQAEALGGDEGWLRSLSVSEFEAQMRAHLKQTIQVTTDVPRIQPHTRQAPTAVASPVAAARSTAARTASTTNLHQEGVDEADWVKTDGRYLYAAINNNPTAGIRISDTRFSQVGLKQISALGFARDIQLQGMYLLAGQKRLILLGQSYQGLNGQPKVTTRVITVDIRNPAKPTVLSHVALEGHSVASRRVNNRLYVVLQHILGSLPATFKSIPAGEPLTDIQLGEEKRKIGDTIDRWTVSKSLPYYQVVGKAGLQPLINVQKDRIYAAPESADLNHLGLVVAINVAQKEFSFETFAYLGGVDHIYASPKAIYLSEPFHDSHNLLKQSLRSDIITTRLLHKLAFKGNGFDYRGSGAIMGELAWNELSTFQFDEDAQGVLRVVTFNQGADYLGGQGDPALASPVILTALAEDPKRRQLITLSRLPNRQQPKALGKRGERLYGARLFNGFAYFVTFRNTDPLYIVDTRNPRAMRVTGALVIPGFSDYLHPVGKNLLLGVGKAAEAQRAGQVQGWKLSLFDISNPTRPREVNKIELGGAGSDSPANRQHHALTSLTVGNITRVAVPVRVVDAENGRVTNGLHRFEVNAPRKQLAHLGAFEPNQNPQWYWHDEDRSLMIGDRLYYFSQGRFLESRWPTHASH